MLVMCLNVVLENPSGILGAAVRTFLLLIIANSQHVLFTLPTAFPHYADPILFRLCLFVYLTLLCGCDIVIDCLDGPIR